MLDPESVRSHFPCWVILKAAWAAHDARYIAVQKDWTIRQVIRHIRDVGKDSETIDVIMWLMKRAFL
jgi:hypothetical protein